jgi:hypothetical protein
MDEDDFYKRPGFRGACLESVFTKEDTSAASSTAFLFSFVVVAFAMLLTHPGCVLLV